MSAPGGLPWRAGVARVSCRARPPPSRAVFPKHCYKPFDAVRLCMMQKLDHDTCTEVYQAFSPCADEMAARRDAALRARDERERKDRMTAAAGKLKQ